MIECLTDLLTECPTVLTRFMCKLTFEMSKCKLVNDSGKCSCSCSWS